MSDAAESSIPEVEKARREFGYQLLRVALWAVPVLIVGSLALLHTIAPPPDPRHDRFVLIRLAAHAVVTVAAVFFFYQVAKLGERMALPAWMKPHSEQIEDPLNAARKLGEQYEKAVSGKVAAKLDDAKSS